MRSRTWMIAVGSLVTTAVLISACGPGGGSLIPNEFRSTLMLPAEGGVNEFTVEAGVPESKVITFGGGSLEGVTILGGMFDIDPSSIETDPTAGATKAIVASQTISLDTIVNSETCVDSCTAAEVDAQVCDDVCVERRLDVTVNVGAPGDFAEGCDAGDRYRFIVVLADDGQPTSVTATPNAFIGNTIALLSSPDGFAACITVLAPFSGTVLINEFDAVVRP